MMPGLSLNWRRTSSTTTAGAADSGHGDATEQIRHETTEEQAGHDVGVGQIEKSTHTPSKKDKARPSALACEELQVFGVGGKQHQRTQDRQTRWRSPW
jgi:hypothetical protein